MLLCQNSTTLVQPWVPPKDPTHGRYDLPYSPREDEIRNDTQRYNTWSGKVHMKGSERDWIAYQVRQVSQFNQYHLLHLYSGLGS